MYPVIDINESLERARMVSQVMALTISGNSYYVQATMTSDPELAAELHKQGTICVNKANRIRDAFWAKFPKAFISPTCPWMNRHG